MTWQILFFKNNGDENSEGKIEKYFSIRTIKNETVAFSNDNFLQSQDSL